MTIAEALPWINLLLVPLFGVVLKINHRLAVLETSQKDHARRLDRLESDLAGLHA